MVELGVEVVVTLDLRLKTPVSGGAGLLHDVGEDGGIGRDAVDEPGRKGVGDGVGDDGRLSV